MTAKHVVTDEQEKIFHKRRRELERRFYQGQKVEDILEGMQLLIEGTEVVSVEDDISSDGWLEDIIESERECHRNFFGREFGLSRFRRTLKKYGYEKIESYRKLGLEPHYLPEVDMLRTAEYKKLGLEPHSLPKEIRFRKINFPGWKIKPGKHFEKWVIEGKILNYNKAHRMLGVVTQPFKFEGITVLIDTRARPVYHKNGTQMYDNDNFLGPVIKQLRECEVIFQSLGDDQVPQSSRFCISADEWESYIKPAIAKRFGFKKSQLRLERIVEANIIPQLYPYMPRKNDYESYTTELYEEFFENSKNRLYSDDRINQMYIQNSRYHSDSMAIRPLVVL